LNSFDISPEEVKVLAGQYRLLEKVSEGGMGVIYKAAHQTLGQVVSIKVLHPELRMKAEYRERFLNEARIQAKLIHHNIVKLFEFF